MTHIEHRRSIRISMPFGMILDSRKSLAAAKERAWNRGVAPQWRASSSATRAKMPMRPSASRKSVEDAGHEVWWDEQIHGGSRFTIGDRPGAQECRSGDRPVDAGFGRVRLGAGRSRGRARQRPAGADRIGEYQPAVRLSSVPARSSWRVERPRRPRTARPGDGSHRQNRGDSGGQKRPSTKPKRRPATSRRFASCRSST